ncbi:MAG: hypothetical protein ABSE73_13995 [Planctomycetota bacterium]
MSKTMAKETLGELEKFIQAKYPDVKMEFSWNISDRLAVLWVYVLDKDKFKAVEAQCKQLTEEHDDKTYPFWVFAEAWSGPWPGGEPIAKIKQRRKEFLAEMRKQYPAPSGRGEPVS